MIHTNKVLVFDLDDTLYNELDFVNLGFVNVSKFLSKKYNINQSEIYNYMLKFFIKYGRDKIFDRTLSYYNIYTKILLRSCINIYRYSFRNILLKPESKFLLENLYKKRNLYLVTDGNKNVQKNKIKLLKISKYFKKIFITHNYGIRYAKPSIHCFKKICHLENIAFKDLIYIGDDPSKDFVNLNKKNSLTIRILNGRCKNMKVKKSYDAKIKIKTLKKLLNYL